MEQHAEYGVLGGWRGRGSLEHLVRELERQKESRVDFVADTRNLVITSDGDGVFLGPQSSQVREWIDPKTPILPQALEQIGERVAPKVPSKFIKEMAKERPARLATLLNGLKDDEPRRRFIRTLDGHVRAYLSDRYRVLDNYDLAFAALEAVQASGGQVVEASLSDQRMRIKFTSQSIWDAINVKRQDNTRSWYAGGLGSQEHLSRVAAGSWGDLPGGPGTVHPLVTLTNSETGHGGYNVRIGLLQAICFNLASVEEVVSRVHLGERMVAGVFTEETVSQESKLIYLKARDAIKAAFTQDTFSKMVEVAKSAQSKEIKAPETAVQNIAQAHSLTKEAKESILAYFVKDYDVTNYGLAQAVARYAQDENDGDTAADLEEVAGSILRLGEAVA